MKENEDQTVIGLLGLLRELECFECSSLPDSPPIFQCANGHLLCKDCHPKTKYCPLCPLKIKGKIRARLAEKILQRIVQKCRYTNCYETFVSANSDRMRKHESDCIFAILNCDTCLQDQALRALYCPQTLKEHRFELKMLTNLKWIMDKMSIHKEHHQSNENQIEENLQDFLTQCLECPVCYEIPQSVSPKMRQCPEGHTFCDSCDKFLVKCPMCNQRLSCKSRIKVAMLETTLVQLLHKCKHAKCQEYVMYQDINQHESNCRFAPVDCEFCKTSVIRQDVPGHSRQCEHRVVLCWYYKWGCTYETIAKEMENHQSVCDYRLVKCRHEGCNFHLFAKDMRRHEVDECIFRYVMCIYPGCNAMRYARDIKEHQRYCQGMVMCKFGLCNFVSETVAEMTTHEQSCEYAQ